MILAAANPAHRLVYIAAPTRTSLKRAMGMLKSSSAHFVLTTTDKATGCSAVIYKAWYCNRLASALQSETYVNVDADMKDIVSSMFEAILDCENIEVPIDNIIKTDKKGVRKYLLPEHLPFCFLTLKAHKTPVNVRMVTSVA